MKFDMHTHTKYSRCSLIEPGRNIRAAIAKGLSGMAVTDHNSIKGALRTARLAKKYPDFEVFVGEEVMTDVGEVLAYGLSEYVKPGRFFDVFDRIKEQGGFVCLAHPFSRGVIRKTPRLDKKILDKIDAVEVFNGRTSTSGNKQAAALAARTGLAKIGGSDAHFYWELGRGYTVCKDANSQKGLIKEILKKQTIVRGDNSFFWVGRVLSFPVRVLR